MKIKYFEYIAVYLSVFLACILIGAIGRWVLIEKGVDDYTAGLFFWISTGFGILIFAILSLFINELVLRILNVFFKKKTAEKQEGILINPKLSDDKISDSNIEQIREKQKNEVANQKQAKTDIVIRYTQEIFAPYVADDELEQLCRNIAIYIEDIDFENIKPVKVRDLSNLDLYHFGWNIWNCLRVSKQDKVAEFLKLTFAESLKEVEQNSIKTHLKDDDQKGIIKIIEENFLVSNYQ